MKTNMGKIDRLIRITAAAVIAVLLLTNMISGTLGLVLLVVSVLLAITSFIGFCPLYAPFGLSTQSRHSKTESKHGV